jgi:lipoprotein NlpD
MMTTRSIVLCAKPAAFVGLFLTALLVGCASKPANPTAGAPASKAPVEDRVTAVGGPRPVSTGAASAVLPLGSENAGKPGYYSVKPGDTLIRVGLENGQNWRDLVRWNQLESPNRIEVGQVIRVIPPVAVATPVPVPGAPATVVSPPVTAPSMANPTGPSAKASADEINWIWPTAPGALLAGFDEVKNKGLDLAGKQGDTVVAAADGRVVYAGSGLRGYGNLIIIKHNETFLSAYAHNQTLLVKEDQSVTKGQKIAEMGQSDSDRVKLHFEIRRQGKPVDPAQYLPKR